MQLTPQIPAKGHFHAMIKGIGALCNLNCAYCYYLHKEGLLHQPHAPRMSDEILEAHIRQYIEAQQAPEVIFSWQGGEPTLLGLDFFHRVVELQAKYKKPGQRVENDLQTNGTLLDEKWVLFLKEQHFLVGLSCDGPRALHDRYRVTKGGGPTHAKVVAAARLLKKHGVPFNILCVVNRENAKYPYDVYRYLTRELAPARVQFIPCVEPRVFRKTAPGFWDGEALPVVGTPESKPGTPDSVVTDWSVDPEDWGRFLCKVWDDWFHRDYGKQYVDIFESVVAQSLGLPSHRCVTSQYCGKGLVIEHNGDVFSCDHFVYPQYRLGSIAQTPWSEMAYGARQQRFGTDKFATLPRACRECEHLKLCWGECPKNRLLRTSKGEAGLNYLCLGQKAFFDHIGRDLPEIQRRVRKSLNLR